MMTNRNPEQPSITLREPEQKETWRAMDEAKQQEFKAGPFSEMPFAVGELVTNADNIIKVRQRTYAWKNSFPTLTN